MPAALFDWKCLFALLCLSYLECGWMHAVFACRKFNHLQQVSDREERKKKTTSTMVETEEFKLNDLVICRDDESESQYDIVFIQGVSVNNQAGPCTPRL